MTWEQGQHPDDREYISHCPACGIPIDHCQGHGEIADPEGALILEAHDDGHHADCHITADCRYDDLVAACEALEEN